jgi:hypothetical protein
MLPALLAALVNLNGPQHYIQWGVIQITVANAIIIGLMVVVFVLAIALPFPTHQRRRP